MSIELYTRTKGGWLVRPDIEFFQFPGGEWHLRGSDYSDFQAHYAVVHGGSADDIVKLLLWQDFLADRNDYEAQLKLHAFVPYLPAARADRGKPFGARVYMGLLSEFAGSLYYTDPHSQVVVDELTDYRSTSQTVVEIPFEKAAVRAVAGRSGITSYVGVIAPDKGAHARAQRVGDALQVPTYFASKQRDFETGKLSSFNAPEEWTVDYDFRRDTIRGMPVVRDGDAVYKAVPPTEGRYLVVDDICDGGGTFMGLASVLGIPRENLDLWVTHGIFSGNAGQLVHAYGNVFTTDSHPGAHNPEVGARVTPLLPYFIEYAK